MANFIYHIDRLINFKILPRRTALQMEQNAPFSYALAMAHQKNASSRRVVVRFV